MAKKYNIGNDRRRDFHANVSPVFLPNPYNFVSSNETVVPSDSDAIFVRYETEKHSGYINLDIKPAKPIFIRGENDEFYKIAGKYALPGSSIKGMISHLIEVISSSRVRFYEKVKREDNSLLDKIVQKMEGNPDAPDFTEVLFGKGAVKQGKLYVEDAVCEKEIPDSCFEPRLLHVLEVPKPGTTNYYTQVINKHPYLKGNKFYWHRDDDVFRNEVSVRKELFDQFSRNTEKGLENYGANIIPDDKGENYKLDFNLLFDPKENSEADNEQRNLQAGLFDVLRDFVFRGKELLHEYLKVNNKKMPPITIAKVLTGIEGVVFKGKIRFENLSDAELGILMMALQLQPGCYHHLGMAKPYGLGRISIQPVLHLINRRSRYLKVLAEDGNWNLAESTIDTEGIAEFRKKAASVILGAVVNPGSDIELSFWQQERMMDLLDLHRVNPYGINESVWTDETKYAQSRNVPGLKLLKSVKDIREQMKSDQEKAKRNEH